MPIIEFEGLGSELLSGVKAAKDAVIQFREETDKANTAIKKQAQDNAAALGSFGSVIEATTKKLTDLRKTSESGTGNLSNNLDSAKDSADGLNKSINVTAQDIAKATFAAKALNDQQRQIQSDAVKVQKAIANGNIEQKKGLQIINELGDEYIKNAALLQQLSKSSEEVATSLNTAVPPVVSLRAQLKNAKDELDRLVEASNGKITPELIAAAKKAGELKNRFDDLNATVEAFNPDTKFHALIGILGNVASGAQAAVAGMGLFGSQSEDVNKALLKIQQTTAFVQGLQGFIGGLADNWKNLKTVILAATVTTETNTVATVENEAALGEQAVATGVATTATVTFSGAMKALKATLLANPITAIITGVVALGAAIYALTGKTEDTTDAVREFGDSLDRIRLMKFDDLDFKMALIDIQAQMDSIDRKETDYAGRISDAEESTKRQIDLLQQKATWYRYEGQLIADNADEEYHYGHITEEVLKQRLAKKTEYFSKANELDQEAVLADRKLALTKMQINKDEKNDSLKTADDKAKELLDKRQRLNDQLIALDEDLAKRSNAAQLQFADPRAQIELQREAANAEVTILENKIKETNAALGRGNILTAEQEAQLAQVRVAIQEAAHKQLLDLEQQYSNDRIQLIADSGERERAEFDSQLKARIEVLKAAGASEVEIAKFTQSQQDAFREKQVNDAIDLEEKIALAKIDAIKQGAETEAEFRKRIELAKLDVQETAAKQRLDVIKDDLSDEAELTRLGLEKILNDIEAKRNELKEKQPDIDIFSLLGIKIDDSQKQQVLNDLKTIGDAVQQAADANIQAQQAQVQAQLDATEQIIQDQQSRREDLKGQLDQALQDQRDGYANNADAIRQQIALTDKAEAEALANKQALQAKQRQLAKEQVILDSAIQVSGMITTSVNLLKEASKGGIAGTIAGLAFAIGLIATFASIRAKIKAAAASDQPQLGEGGLLKGPSHAQGGVSLIDRRTGQHFATAEGDEFVVNKRSTAKYRKMIEAINESDTAKLQTAAVNELLSGSGIELDRGMVREIIRTKETLIRTERQMMPEGFDAMRREIRDLKEEVKGFRKQEGEKPETSDDGKTTKEPKRTIRKR